MDTAEIVVCDLKRHGTRMVIQLLWKAVCEAGEPLLAHAKRRFWRSTQLVEIWADPQLRTLPVTQKEHIANKEQIGYDLFIGVPSRFRSAASGKPVCPAGESRT